MEIQGLVSIIHKGPPKFNSKAARDLLGKTSKILQQMLPLEGCAEDKELLTQCTTPLADNGEM